ncbi:hypothetical protein L208DRAFT_1279210 [Tricholoma matsutake]|nr:hypothetical protein L208DRAFT_1279210 [Tricholoma matsutake 945]
MHSIDRIIRYSVAYLCVIQQFINRSWWFMNAYQKGLTGNAAAWAVRKQKQHHQVSNMAMMSIDAVLNPS